MIIGIDGNEANANERVGVNVYAFELLRHIYQLSQLWKDKHKFVIYLQDRPRADMPPENSSWKYKIIPGRKLWIVTKLTPLLWKQRLTSLFGSSHKKETVMAPDVFFTPSHYVPPMSPVPTICSIMDLGYLEFSGQFKKYDFWQLNLWSAYSILVSKCIITISESSKKDIVRHYPLSKDKTIVTYPGYDALKFNKKVPRTKITMVKKKYDTGEDYLLFISTLKPSKNLSGLIEAFDKLVKLDQVSGNLVVAGRKGWLYADIFEKVKKLGIEDRIIFTDFVPENEKAALISGAKCLVLPSFWEGFGLDIISAMACGVPVVASGVGSLPEVVGNAGIIVDPYNVDSIREGILKILRMSRKDYNSLVAKGFSQIKKFSWDKTARTTLEILERANK